MMNNTALDFTPYFMSANHCAVPRPTTTPSSSTELRVAGVQRPRPRSLADNQTGSTFRRQRASDFLLLGSSAMPDPAFNVFYAGWDRTGVAPPGVACVHHPSVDVKAISFGNTPPQSTAYYSDVVNPAANHWRVTWDVLGPNGQTAITEPGSSGSCIFTSDTHRCIGQLHGGPSACGVAPASLHDFYGKFSVSWTGGATDATRLSNWLDPVPTGAMTLDGDPHITTLDGTNYDFQGAGEYVAFRDATGVEVQARQAPIATTFNPGANDHTGLATCVSLNTAVAARVASGVTYQPNSGRVRSQRPAAARGRRADDAGTGGSTWQRRPHLEHGRAGRHRHHVPGALRATVTPGFWTSQGKWYLNIGVTARRTTAWERVA
jgi:hypothetical protein